MLICWVKHTQKPTYGALILLLDKYSIFCGKDPLVLAGRERVSSVPSRISKEKLLRYQASSFPDQSAVFKSFLPIASEWQNIATLLRIPSGRIKAVRQENLAVTNNCLRAMLEEWLQRFDLNPSWSALAEAVELLGNQEVAQTIRDEYIQPNEIDPACYEPSTGIRTADTVIGTGIHHKSTTEENDYSGSPPNKDQRPKPNELLALNHRDKTVQLIQDVASQWKDLARALGFSEELIESIETGAEFQNEEACHQILFKWLEGDSELCEPVTWNTLIQCLIDAGL